MQTSLTVRYNAEHKDNFADSNLPLAVVVARTKWNEPPRMRHQLTRQLLRHFNVLFIELFHERDLAPKLDVYRKESERLLVFSPGVPFTVSTRLYTNDPITHHVVNRYLQEKICQFVGAFDAHVCLLVNFVFDFPEIMRAELFEHSLYVCYDEFPKMWRRASRPNLLKYVYQAWLGQRYEDQVARRADRLLATHTPLLDKLRRINPNTTLFLHGHELQEVVGQGRPRPDGGGKIRVGFMGYINYRLLLDWMLAILADPKMELTLIGPIRKFDLVPFLEHPNFHHIPEISGSALAESLVNQDVLILPYDPAPPENHVQTISNKFYQYLAAGRPVVISDMPYYLDMPAGFLYRARTADEFVSQVRKAHAEDCEEFVRTRQALAAENTWDRRGDELFALLDKDFPSLLSFEKAGKTA